MSKRVLFTLILVVGISAGLLAVQIADTVTAPYFIRSPKTVVVEMSWEEWRQVEKILIRP